MLVNANGGARRGPFCSHPAQRQLPPATRHPCRDAGTAAGASPSTESQSKTQQLDEPNRSRATPSSKQSTKSSCSDERKTSCWKVFLFLWPSNIILETQHSFPSEDKYLKLLPGIKAWELLGVTTGQTVICTNYSLQRNCFQRGFQLVAQRLRSQPG